MPHSEEQALVTKKLLILEGLDRSGKDSLAFDLQKKSVMIIRVNDFSMTGNQPYYETTRMMFKSGKSLFASEVGRSMAIVEFLQALTWMRQFHYWDKFVLVRSFVSTLVYDSIRGIKGDDVSNTIMEMITEFEKNTGWELDVSLLKMFVDKEDQLYRGSSQDSFEQVNFDSIKRGFELYTDSTIFSREVGVNTSKMSPDKVLTIADALIG